MDFTNEIKSAVSLHKTGATASANGSSMDCQDCGPEVSVDLSVGATNTGNDSTLAVKLQESDDDSDWSDISSATMTTVSGDTTNNYERKTFYNRSKRYVRAVATIAGTSPVIDYAVLLQARKVSY